jgi:DNA polymerase III delta prime subunit
MADPDDGTGDTPEQWAAKEAAIACLDVAPPIEEEPPTEAPFVVTKEYRRLAEFADVVRRERYVGLCYGPPGVGKTLSARRYARWDLVEHAVQTFKFFEADRIPREILDTRSAVYTPKVHNSPGRLDKELAHIQDRLSWMVQTLEHPEHDPPLLSRNQDRFAELLLVDEADRLKTPTLEQLRDRHDRTGVGLILIGMPGIEKRLARYPQLYSRVGFVHHRVLSAEEQAFVLARHWPELGLHDPEDFTTAEALATIIRITSGNFRLTARLVVQIKRSSTSTTSPWSPRKSSRPPANPWSSGCCDRHRLRPHPPGSDDIAAIQAALTAAGCTAICCDEQVPIRADWPQFDRALAAVPAGGTLVVCRLIHIGRSLEHLADLLTRLDHRGVGSTR